MGSDHRQIPHHLGHLGPEKLKEFYISETEKFRKLVEKAGVSFKPINSGKFRRYFSFWNVSDLFRVGAGLAQSLAFLKKEKPLFDTQA